MLSMSSFGESVDHGGKGTCQRSLYAETRAPPSPRLLLSSLHIAVSRRVQLGLGISMAFLGPISDPASKNPEPPGSTKKSLPVFILWLCKNPIKGHPDPQGPVTDPGHPQEKIVTESWCLRTGPAVLPVTLYSPSASNHHSNTGSSHLQAFDPHRLISVLWNVIPVPYDWRSQMIPPVKQMKILRPEGAFHVSWGIRGHLYSPPTRARLGIGQVCNRLSRCPQAQLPDLLVLTASPANLLSHKGPGQLGWRKSCVLYGHWTIWDSLTLVFSAPSATLTSAPTRSRPKGLCPKVALFFI